MVRSTRDRPPCQARPGHAPRIAPVPSARCRLPKPRLPTSSPIASTRRPVSVRGPPAAVTSPTACQGPGRAPVQAARTRPAPTEYQLRRLPPCRQRAGWPGRLTPPRQPCPHQATARASGAAIPGLRAYPALPGSGRPLPGERRSLSSAEALLLGAGRTAPSSFPSDGTSADPRAVHCERFATLAWCAMLRAGLESGLYRPHGHNRVPDPDLVTFFKRLGCVDAEPVEPGAVS